ncbi:hypothetical protein Dimus_005330 [Dionaea muscipula]
MKDHELPYGDWLTMVFEEFGVPLVNKKGEEPKRYDYFEETFLTMCIADKGKWSLVDWCLERIGEGMMILNLKKKRYMRKKFKKILIGRGKSGSDDQFFDAQVDVEEPVTKVPSCSDISSFTRRFHKSTKE